MSARKDGGAAFPRDYKWNLDGSICQEGACGMTLRAYIATAQLSALVGAVTGNEKASIALLGESARTGKSPNTLLAEKAVLLADTLIKELKK